MKKSIKNATGLLMAKLAALLLAFGFAGSAWAITVEGLELPNMRATILDTKAEEFPNSNLNELTQPLDHAVHFAIPLTTEQQTALNGNYFVDFVLRVNKDVLLVDPAAIMPQIQNGTLTVEQAAAMPAGCIVGAVNPSNPWWIAVPTMGQMQLSANTPYRVCSDMAAQGTINWTLQVGPGSLWGENESGFLCGIWFTPGFHAANPDLVITLEPRLYKYNVEDQGNPTDMGSLGETLRFPAPHVTVIPPAQEEPTAVVAAIDNGFFTTTATEAETIDYSELLPNLSVEFNAAAVQQIATTAGDSSIRLKIKDVTESGVTDSKTIQITLVDQNDTPVYAEGTAAGTATVTVPFAVESGKVPVVYYVNGTNKTKVDGATYNSEKGTVSFTVTHFSEYEITTENAQLSVAQIVRDNGATTNKYESLAAAILAATAASDSTVEVLVGEIDCAGWTPVTINSSSKLVTLDGKGVVLKNLSAPLFSKDGSGVKGVVVKNVTVKDANITTSSYAAAFLPYADSTETAYFENCHVVDSTITSTGNYAAGFVAYAAGYNNQNDGPVFSTVTIKDCSVKNSTITGANSTGGLLGHATGNPWTLVNVEGTEVAGNTITCTGSSNVKAGSLFGTVGVAGAEDNGRTGGIVVGGDSVVTNNTATSNGVATDRIFGRIGSTGGELAVTGGTYDGTATYADDTYDSTAGHIVISGGSFKTVPSSDAVVEGYAVEGTPNAEGYYTVAVDPTVAKIGDTKYESLAEALADVTKDTPLTWVSESAWPSATPVYYNGTPYATLTAAINAANEANASAAALIYVRPNYSAGTGFTADHDNIKTSITIYGNNASLNKSWEPTIEYSGGSYHTLTKDVTFALYNLHDGAGAWGSRTSDFTSTVVMCNCTNAHEVYVGKSSGSGVNNFTVKNSTFAGTGDGSKSHMCAVKSNNPGTVLVEGCAFTGIAGPVNCSNDGPGTQTLTVKDCTFTDCSVAGSKGWDATAATYCAPIRAVAKAGADTTLAVDGCEFVYTGAETASDHNGDILVGETRTSSGGAGIVTYTVENTAAKLTVSEAKDKNVPATITSETLVATNDYTGDNTPPPPVARVVKSNGTVTNEYADLATALNAGKASGSVVTLLKDVDLNNQPWTPIGTASEPFQGTFDGANHNISNLYINLPEQADVGLFASGAASTFKNFTIVNANVVGYEDVAVVFGRTGGSGFLASNVTVRGSIKVESKTTSKYGRVGGIAGGWVYGHFVDCSVIGDGIETSYIKAPSDARYAGGIVGHADDVQEYTRCVVKDIRIMADWLCGGVAGPGPASSTTTGCVVDNVEINADYSGGLFGWLFTPSTQSDETKGVIDDCTVSNVSFTLSDSKNGAIGGYSIDPDVVVKNITVADVHNKTDDSKLLTYNATIVRNKEGGVDVYYYATPQEAVDNLKNENEVITVPNYTAGMTAPVGWDFSTDSESGVTTLVRLPPLVTVTIGGTTTDYYDLATALEAGKAAGSVVKLLADIDLAGVAWTPVGTTASPFYGSIDGNGKTISNLTINDPTLDYAGLIGYGNGGTPAQVIKDLTISNATITARMYVGVLGGCLYANNSINNVTVKGLIQVTGNYMVGGVVGQSYIHAYDSAIVGDEGSFVKGLYLGGKNEVVDGMTLPDDCEGDNVGGFIGHMGEGSALGLFNCSASGLTVMGTRKVGGLVGTIPPENHLENVSVSGVTIGTTADAAYATAKKSSMEIGGVVGSYYNNGTGGVISGTVQDVTIAELPTGVTGTGDGKNISYGLVTGGNRGADPASKLDYSALIAKGYDAAKYNNSYLINNYVAVVTDAEGNFVGGYETVDAALSSVAASAKAGCTVSIFAGEYALTTTSYSLANGVSVIGETDASGNNLVTIKNNLSITASGVTLKDFDITVTSGTAFQISGNGLIEHVNITGPNATRWCYANNGDVTFKNCSIKGTVYGIHFDGGTGNVNVIDCEIAGFNTFAGTLEEVDFADTTFTSDSNYHVINFWGDAVVSNCTLNPQMVIGVAGTDNASVIVSDTVMTDGSSVAAHSEVGQNAAKSFAIGTGIMQDENGKVTGGVFEVIDAGVIADGYISIPNEDSATSADYPLTVGGPYAAVIYDENDAFVGGYNGFKAAIDAANASSSTELTVKLLCDIEEPLPDDLEAKKTLLITTDVTGGVELNLHSESYMAFLATANGCSVTFDSNVNVTGIRQLGTYADTAVLNLNNPVRLSQFYAAGGTININPDARIRFYHDGAIHTWGAKYVINGSLGAGEGLTATVASVGAENLQIDGGYVNYRYNAGAAFTMSNAIIRTQFSNGAPGDSNTFPVTLYNSVIYATGSSFSMGTTSQGTLTLIGSRIVADGATVDIDANDNVVMDWKSSITTKNFSNAGTITVDMAGFDGTLPLTLVETTDAAATLGTVQILNNTPSAVVKVDANGNIVAVEAVAQIGDEKYESLAEAVAAANADDTVQLLTDVELDEAVDITQSITLDLNGKTISISEANEDGYAISVSSGTVTITGNGAIDAGDDIALDVAGGSVTIANGTFSVIGVDDGSLTITDGTFTDGLLTAGGTTTINGGTFNDTVQVDGGAVTINGGTFSSDDNVLVVTDSTGSITVNGGSFTATGVTDLVACAQDGGSIEIANGTFSGGSLYVGTAITETDGTIAVSGGMFGELVAEKFCATGFLGTTRPDENGMYTVVTAKTVTFVLGDDAPDGATAPETLHYPGGDEAETALPQPTYTSTEKTFAGWTNALGEVMSVIPAGSTTDFTLFAMWGGVNTLQIDAGGTGLTTIKVTDAWLAANNLSEADNVAITNALAATAANGNKVWENYVLGINNNTAVNAEAEQGATTLMPVSGSIDVPSVDTGFTVKYRLDKVSAAGEVIETGTLQETSDLTLELSDVTGNAYYKVTAVITATDESEAEASVSSTNTIGVLAVESSAKTTAIAVPWESLDGGEISVSNLVRTANLTPGDELKAYYPYGKNYKAWVLDENKTWQPATVVGGSSETAADAYPIPRGAGVWLTRADPSQPIYLVGGASASGDVKTSLEAASGGNPSWNLVGNPSVEPVSVAALLDGKSGDKIIVPTAGAPKNYVYEADKGGWGYWTTETIVLKNGRKVAKSVFKTDDANIPAGIGFWYLNSSEEAGAEIDW